jgi:hypothetical protein
MFVKFIRNTAASWLNRIRTAAENVFDGTLKPGEHFPAQQHDPLSGFRGVWYGRAMFCAYFPNGASQEKYTRSPLLATEADQPSDLHARAQLDHPVVGELEELDRAACIAGHCGE